jgi:SOS-response transcriptional repressor LexA
MALNPIAYTEKIITSFLKYQLTTYPLADPNLHQQMRALLSLEQTRQSPLLKGPYISLSRSFRQGMRVQELIAEGVLHPALAGLISFPYVYGHQERAIRSIHEGHPTLVSTGTGSGKTECFLYPIVSRCLALRDEGADPGIVAVLVYPMNALAEDQLTRLRDFLAGTGISFGMYVGKTPEDTADVSGKRLKSGASREQYRRELERAQQERRGTAVHPSEERCSREEMRAAGGQPRILLTNVKQLELLLTRQTDESLFDGARLEYLVFDEAHTFSGAVGAETACLIRRLRSFIGKGTRDTTCIATSATIADPERGSEAGRSFAARFFGVSADQVQLVAEEYESDLWNETRTVSPALPGDQIGHLTKVLKAVDAGEQAGSLIADALNGMVGAAIDQAGWEASLHELLSSNEVVFQLAQGLSRPRPLASLLGDVTAQVGRQIPEEEALAWLALGAAARRDGRPLLRPVVHNFVRGVPGAVATFPDPDGHPRLWLSAEDEEGARKGAETSIRLRLMTCTTCGQHYFTHAVADFLFTGEAPGGGEAVGNGVVWRTLDENVGGRRVVLLDRLISANEDDGDPPRTAPVCLCRSCGALHPNDYERCLACGLTGPLVRLLAVAQKEDIPCRLTRCLSCGSPGRQRGTGYREPARPVRAVTVSDVHVLAQDMVHHAERRRLLVFTDNRQDAAFQAGWMQDHSRRFRLRALMTEHIHESGIRIGDLTARLDDALAGDSELSRTLAGEVWSQYRQEGAPQEHARERKYFLRSQVLREVATGVKQRIGLEPWGRIRLQYEGLSPSSPFVVNWAGELSLPADRLMDGIAALLDRMRRGYHLLDPETRMFSRFWGDGDREILMGYFPQMPGVPKGLKLQRDGGDDRARVSAWYSQAGDTPLRQAALKWGVPRDQVLGFLEALWEWLSNELKVLAPVTLTGYRGRAIPGCNGVRQVDVDKLLIVSNRGLWRCGTCRRTQPRPTPLDRCLAWRCDGELQYLPEDPDNYDLALLDAGVQMIRPREHSAQIPASDRELLERQFKSERELVNTLVCTPTLELGVDIGALDTVLMRNVPPLPSNYWQRVGRAGRRHRMAVNVTYARTASHDRVYFAAPLRMLEGKVEPPSFNLRNELMVKKHVHAAVLSRLHQLTHRHHGLSEGDRAEIGTMLATAFPSQTKSYLFDEEGNVRTGPFDVSIFRTVVSKHETILLNHIRSIFAQGWPEPDNEVVTEDRLKEYVQHTADDLEEVMRALKKRLGWAMEQMRRLNETRVQRGTLEPDEEALFQRCNRLIKRLKGQDGRQRRETEGFDDISTFSVLAAEGFLPGYGLETGSILGTAQVPRIMADGRDLDLRRPSAMAVREFVPGNRIYANGQRFQPRYYHFEADSSSTTLFQVDTATGAVTEVGASQGRGALGAGTLRAVPICDVDMTHLSHITDEEENRFQLPVAVYGYELGRHAGGQGFRWGTKDLFIRRGVHFRLVNVGAVSLIDNAARLGYPVCLVCGQSRSPFSSQTERDKFAEDHQQRCSQRIQPTGFYTDVVADALSIPEFANREEAYSVLEALRTGATRVLEMETEDLNILVIGIAGREEASGLLYDPMPGGSGLLDQICARFPEVAAAALEVVNDCPSLCPRACIDCLFTFRNAFFHQHLNRRLAADKFSSWGAELSPSHPIPPRLPATAPSGRHAPVGPAEMRLRQLIQSAGFPEPKWQHGIQLGRPLGSTTPDCFFAGEDEQDPGICIYLDGLSEHIHGNPTTAMKDRQIREELRSRHYEVFEIPYTDLDDKAKMAQHFYRLGRILLGKDRAKSLRDDPTWFTEAATEQVADIDEKVVPFRKVQGAPVARYKTCVPLVSLKAAAGGFGDSDAAETLDWVEPNTTRRLREGMFVAQVVGHSMEPLIPDGSYCLFAAPVIGSRTGRILLVQHRDIADAQTGGSFTVKKFDSTGVSGKNTTERAGVIVLRPLNPAYEPIELKETPENEVAVVAEFLEVLK